MCVRSSEPTDVMEFLRQKYVGCVEGWAAEHWEATAWVIGRLCVQQRDLEIHAYPRECVPGEVEWMDLTCGPFGMWLPDWHTREAEQTGCSAEVIAYFVKQRETAMAVRYAVLEVEARRKRSFVFACESGTHASPAAAILLATLAYPHARVCFHQSRAAADFARLVRGAR